MKKIVFFLLVAFGATSSFATIRRVNNNSGIVAVSGLVYTSLQAAINDAVSNDTIYIEPSSTNYTITAALTKKLHFIGNGYYIDKNQNLVSPLPFNTKISQIESTLFSINAGSEGTTFRSISFINTQINANANELLFSRCNFYVGATLHLTSSNNIVEQCFGYVQASISSTGSNIFRNCIWVGSISSQTNGLFDQCYIGNLHAVNSCVFTNCIIRSYSALGSTNNFSFCIKLIDNINNTFPTAGINNNIENVAAADVFVENPSNIFDATDKSFRNKDGSPALNAGSSGQDIGPFGGADPYRLSGQAGIPIIRNFYLSTTGSTASGLSGSITIQSNN